MLRESQINGMGFFCPNLPTNPSAIAWNELHPRHLPDSSWTISFPLLSREPKQLTRCQGMSVQWDESHPFCLLYGGRFFKSDGLLSPLPSHQQQRADPFPLSLTWSSSLFHFSQGLRDRSMIFRTTANQRITIWETWGLTWGFITCLTRLLQWVFVVFL